MYMYIHIYSQSVIKTKRNKNAEIVKTRRNVTRFDFS